jgi:formylglycine-generating enzyme required for sulfatase activity
MGRPNPIFIEQNQVYLTVTTSTPTPAPLQEIDFFFIPSSGQSCNSVSNSNNIESTTQTVPDKYHKVADIEISDDNCGPYKIVLVGQLSPYFAIYNNGLYIDKIVLSLPSRTYDVTISIIDIANRFAPRNSYFSIDIDPCPVANANSANYNLVAVWNNQVGNVTTVGTNGISSAYGTYDQGGNVFEWNDLNGTSNASRGIRGGDWIDNDTYNISSSGRYLVSPESEYVFLGFRVSTISNPLSLSNFVSVGDINNNMDINTYGGVSYEYKIGIYEVTNCEYVEFLNSVAKDDVYQLYNPSMTIDPVGGIERLGSDKNYTYAAKNSMANKPVVFVSWFDCARYCNWLHNGKGNGSTETGAYNLNGNTTGNAISKNLGAKYYLPTENEWYKAAYYKSGGINMGYWLYPTQSNIPPTTVSANNIGDGSARQSEYICQELTVVPTTTTTTTTTSAPSNTTTTIAPGSSSANYALSADWNTEDGNVTTVGSNGGPSFYGAYDMSGNVWEFIDFSSIFALILRGGAWSSTVFALSSSSSNSFTSTSTRSDTGFRVVSRLNPLPLSNFVLVRDINNNNDFVGYGSVSYEYFIGQYPVTNCEYVEFLNSVASTDLYGLFNPLMSSDDRGGINRFGSNGFYTYAFKPNMGNKPVVYVSWFNCARYCNWLHNGKGVSSTETGAYTLNGSNSGNPIARNANANYSLATNNEWHKAAYYKGGNTNSGYWTYATQSNSTPTPIGANSIGDGSARISNYTCSTTTSSTTTGSPSILAGLVGWDYGPGRVASFCNIAGTEDLFNPDFVTLFQNTCVWLTKNKVNPRILVLQSGNSDHMARLLTVLSQISSNVASSSSFWGSSFFASNISTSNRDLLIIPCSYTANYTLQNAPNMPITIQNQIVNFVNSGGSLLTTESFIWLLSQNKMLNLSPIIPIVPNNRVIARLSTPQSSFTFETNRSIVDDSNTILQYSIISLNVSPSFTFFPSYQPSDGVAATRISASQIKPGATMFYKLIPSGTTSFDKNFSSIQV